MLDVICVNAGNYQGRGVDYVRVLNDMVRRNLPEGYAGRFTVFTDTSGDYGPEIIVRPLPEPGLTGWWNKLAVFKAGVFERGSHVLYLDLDTLICGRMDAIADYRGDFAILRDFYRADGWQSSVMAWTVGEASELIWTEWDAAGRPALIGGDQAWIECVAHTPDLWQDIAPGQFVSYKLTEGAPPETAPIVVFHGNPRPHEVTTGWVSQVWKEGGMTRAELDAVCNTAREQVDANVRSACARDLPWFDFTWEPTEAQACIVGGGPTLKDQLPAIRRRIEDGQQVWALNGAFDYLCANGITPDAHVIIDARPENAGFVRRPSSKTRYFIASQCEPSVFDALDGCDVTLFHCQADGMADLLAENARLREKLQQIANGTYTWLECGVKHAMPLPPYVAQEVARAALEEAHTRTKATP